MTPTTAIHKWFAIAVVSGSEQKTVRTIKNKLQKKGLLKPGMEFICPDEEITVMQNGDKIQKRRLTLPGYVLLRCRNISDDALYQIDHTAGVLEFLGGSESPTELSNREVEQMLGTTQVVGGTTVSAFEVGDTVEVKTGAMQGFTGEVIQFNDARTKVRVDIAIFGRSTPTEVAVEHLRKVE